MTDDFGASARSVVCSDARKLAVVQTLDELER